MNHPEANLQVVIKETQSAAYILNYHQFPSALVFVNPFEISYMPTYIVHLSSWVESKHNQGKGMIFYSVSIPWPYRRDLEDFVRPLCYNVISIQQH